ncbi:12728_t:CDS:2 [Gigaspora rosea]|nr:12728_t:CDS:2 [Gigaspora rosea]
MSWNDQDDVLIWWLTLDIQPNYLEKLVIKILNLKPHNASSKVYPWCVSNSKKELKYFSNKITKEEIKYM